MGLNMRGHVSGPFVTHRGVQRMRHTSHIVDHIPMLTLVQLDTFDANVQPASDKEIEFLHISPERVNDIRVIHRNDGKGIEISGPGELADILIFAETPDKEPSWWKAMATDYRPWHNFCRSVIAKLDPGEIAKLQGYTSG